MQVKYRFLVLLVVVTIVFQSCSNKKKRYIPVVDNSRLPGVTVHIKQYGKALFEIDTTRMQEGLKKIQPEFRLFLNASLDDTANVNQLKAFVTDTLNRYLYQHTSKVYSTLKPLEKTLSISLSRFHYYFPDQKLPSFYSYISGGYFEAPVLSADSVVLIGLDNYLGSDFIYYARMGIPRYKTHWMIKQEVPVDVMKTLYETLPFRRGKARNLLDMMISAGKELYYLDAMMPDLADTLKIRYTAKQLSWVEKNEKNLWGFLVGQKLLFSANFMQTNKLMQDGPFTKGFDAEAPARLGEWVGWQIVSAYMNKNRKVTLKQLLQNNDSQMILNQSGYKP